MKISSTEDVVIAFYKTGNHRPDFEHWIKETDPYRTTAPFLRPKTMKKELARLKNAYASFNPEENFLTLKTDVFAEIRAYQDKEKPKETTHLLEMSFVAGDAGYFPYEFLKKRFAVVPQELQKHLKPEIPKEQAAYLKQQLGNEGGRVRMILQLRPLEADMKAPYQVDGHKQWAFLTQIASLSLWSDHGGLLWEYTAPWYITPLHKSLLGLHTDKSVVK